MDERGEEILSKNNFGVTATTGYFTGCQFLFNYLLLFVLLLLLFYFILFYRNKTILLIFFFHFLIFFFFRLSIS